MNYEQLLSDMMQKDDRYMILTAENRSAMRNISNTIPDRFIDTGIAEQTMVGMAAGLASRGRIPIVHALATFLTLRAFEFIRTDIGIANLPVKLVGAVPGFLSDGNGPTHQAIEDVSLMRGIPTMNVFCPADEEDLILGIEKIFPYNSPFYIRYNNLKPVVKHSPFEIGKAEVLFEGDIMILTYGLLLKEALLAREILLSENISAGVINMRSLKPLDRETVSDYCRRSDLIVTLEDHFITGGLFSILSEMMVFENISCEIFPIGLKSWFKPALLNDVLEYEGFTGKAIAHKISKKFKSDNNLFKLSW
ncbi:MAG: transketolase C-terminal domain-containing protein [Ignavibacteriaceae bacterium]|nr:transketolase C-terminal domain-containing protein [Ignavibacteriaceae bacterium]